MNKINKSESPPKKLVTSKKVSKYCRSDLMKTKVHAWTFLGKPYTPTTKISQLQTVCSTLSGVLWHIQQLMKSGGCKCKIPTQLSHIVHNHRSYQKATVHAIPFDKDSFWNIVWVLYNVLILKHLSFLRANTTIFKHTARCKYVDHYFLSPLF